MVNDSNPWLRRNSASARGDEVGEELPARATSTRVLGPQPGAVPPPDVSDQLPVRPVEHTALGWAVAAHGGAGETTLARVLGARQGQRSWPASIEGERVVLVARTNAVGLAAARRAAQQWAAGAAGGVHLVGLVLMADAPGRLPRPLRALVALTAGGVATTWQLPWVEALRMETSDGADAALARAASTQLDQIRNLLRNGEHG